MHISPIRINTKQSRPWFYRDSNDTADIPSSLPKCSGLKTPQHGMSNFESSTHLASSNSGFSSSAPQATFQSPSTPTSRVRHASSEANRGRSTTTKTLWDSQLPQSRVASSATSRTPGATHIDRALESRYHSQMPSRNTQVLAYSQGGYHTGSTTSALQVQHPQVRLLKSGARVSLKTTQRPGHPYAKKA